MFKPGQLLQAMVLDSAALLVSIKHGLATDPIAQEHLGHLCLPQPSAPESDLWSLSKDGELLLLVLPRLGFKPVQKPQPDHIMAWLAKPQVWLSCGYGYGFGFFA